MIGSVCVAVTLLMCVLGGQALDLLRASTTSGNPPDIPRVHCWCAGYPNVTLCSWPEPSNSPPTHYIATYSERQMITKQCDLIPPGSPSSFRISASSSSSERLWHVYLPNLKLLTDYIINVTAVHSGGRSTHLSSFMLEEIVKPDPPVDVRVSPLNIRNLLVEWSPPPTWANLYILPLKYQIFYQWENRGTPMSVNCPAAGKSEAQLPVNPYGPLNTIKVSPLKLGPFEQTAVELKLTPGRTYLIQVCAKELLGLGECSDWSSPVKITMPRVQL